MPNQVYSKDGYVIFKVRHGFIVHNTEKDFEDGHTHLKNFKASKGAISYVRQKKIPTRSSIYYLTSLERLSTDHQYKDRIRQLIEARKKRDKPSYINVNKGAK